MGRRASKQKAKTLQNVPDPLSDLASAPNLAPRRNLRVSFKMSLSFGLSWGRNGPQVFVKSPRDSPKARFSLMLATYLKEFFLQTVVGFMCKYVGFQLPAFCDQGATCQARCQSGRRESDNWWMSDVVWG